MGLIKGTDQIFTQGMINTGLAANAAIYLRKQRRGDLNKRDAAHIRCSGKTRHIAYDAAAKGYKQ